jgi:hypothetical protein
MKLKKIKCSELNSRQKESYNLHKVSYLLADYGLTTVRLHDDYQIGDFLAISADEQYRVQLKSRPTIAKAYEGIRRQKTDDGFSNSRGLIPYRSF